MRQNPASEFIARFLAEKFWGCPWREIDPVSQATWRGRTHELIISMYDAGFQIPMPDDAEQIWADLQKNSVSSTP